MNPTRTPPALYALAIGAFGIGTTEFAIMGLLQQVSASLGVSIASAGLLISGYAFGVFVGAPAITLATRRLPRKLVLLGLMAVFTLGNLACALATSYSALMAARVLTSLAHGTFFGVGSVVATSLVPEQRKASAIATMFNGLALATLIGVPACAWLGLHHGWHAAFWAITAIGVLAMVSLAVLLPATHEHDAAPVSLDSELRAITGVPVLIGLATTIFGFAGVFVVYTFIEPLLTRVTGFGDAMVSPVLLVFGLGMAIGNPLGGKLADRHLSSALVGTLAALAVVLVAFGFAMQVRWAMVLTTGLLGMAMFATVAPLQMWVLRQAAHAPSLASSLNIGAFNLANALGAWLGSAAVARGAGLTALPWIAAAVTVLGIALAAQALRGQRAAQTAPLCPQA
ncbi:MFS transporter [Rhodanobacter sp. PCA2]|uniref:MFS transporter n=1 Tax=Rhodanobacter sp. PCA2 TaxID=2006117 RepID=UPI0015E66AB1|nr:MFS transporter [Rhodanobacter sp. PCA2]MBA2077157.1 MFS transporter [Rhodanobacter sp. PCA2]